MVGIEGQFAVRRSRAESDASHAAEKRHSEDSLAVRARQLDECARAYRELAPDQVSWRE